MTVYFNLPATQAFVLQAETNIPADGSEALPGDAVWNWFTSMGVPILIIIAIAVVLFWIVRTAVPRVVERSMLLNDKDKRARDHVVRRGRTLSSLLVNIVGIVIAVIALMTILDKLNVPIAPLLTSAGIVGVAVGLGTQSLVKDLISGMFIMVEDQYNHGDVVEVAGVIGKVEDMSFRRTVLRDVSGTLHTIPNSAIIITSNYTRDLSRVNLDLPVDYGTDLNRAMSVIDRVGEELAGDDYFGKLITSPPKALRVNNFADAGIEIKILGDTTPGSQWEVAGEFRRRIKQSFDAEGIEIHWPHIKLHMAGDARLTCPVCRHPVLPGVSFCSGCGAPLRPANP